MNRGLAADLARWERGEARAEELVGLHPDARVDALVEMHAFLSYLVSDTADEPGPSWEALAERLPDREPVRATVVTLAPRRLPIRRVLAAFLTGAVLAPAAAAADKPRAIRELNDRVGRAVSELFTPGDSTDGTPTGDAMSGATVVFVPAASETPVADGPVPLGIDAPAPAAVEPVPSAPPPVTGQPAVSRPSADAPGSTAPGIAPSSDPASTPPPDAPTPDATPAPRPTSDEPVAGTPVAGTPVAGTPSVDKGRSAEAPGQVKKADAGDPGRSAENSPAHSAGTKGRPSEVPGRGDQRRA